MTKSDDLIDFSTVQWLVGGLVSNRLLKKDFPKAVVTDKPQQWSRTQVKAWLAEHQKQRLDCDMAQAFIRRPAVEVAL